MQYGKHVSLHIDESESGNRMLFTSPGLELKETASRHNKTRSPVEYSDKRYKWADSSVLRSILRIQPHLEYVVQLWDPYIMKDIRMLESVQKFACMHMVCLKCWDMDYDNMLHCLNWPRLSERRQYLKLLTMYNIVNGHLYFPEGIFVAFFVHAFPRHTTVCIFIHHNFMISIAYID